MPSFEEYARSFIGDALGRVPAAEAADAYVVSLLVYDEEDDPRMPTVTVGFNTEAQVEATASGASGPDEARWNYAFWLQNDLGVLGDEERDPRGAALREAWLRDQGVWYDDEDEDDEEADPTGAFVELIVRIARSLHEDGTVERVFGRPIPVLVHELEYYDEIARQNERANPGGLAGPFAAWIDSMY